MPIQIATAIEESELRVRRAQQIEKSLVGLAAMPLMILAIIGIAVLMVTFT